MDFSKFTSSDFDAKEWINEVFRNAEAQNNEEQYASALVLKLQLLIQEVAKSLEDTSQQIVLTLPKLSREITIMKQEGTLLKQKMLAVESDVEKVEHDAVSTMDSLLSIDDAKRRVLEVEKALKEVDNWTTLTKDVEEVFQTGNADIISSRLYNMQQSMIVLGTKVKDYKERCDFLERLKDQFIAAVSPSVVASLTSQNTDAAQYFLRIFTQLNRKQDFENNYHHIHKVEILKHWKSLTQNDDYSEPDALLNAFYDYLLTFWFDKVRWLTMICNVPQFIMQRSFIKSLSTLDPTIESALKLRLCSIESVVENRPVLSLIRCKLSADNIVQSLQSNIMHNIDTSVVEFSEIEKLLTEFYRPLVLLLENYQNYEQSYLLRKLNKLNLDKTSDISSTVERFQKSIDVIYNDCCDVLNNCSLLSHDLILSAAIAAIELFFENYFTVLTRAIDALSISNMDSWNRFESLLKMASFSGSITIAINKIGNEIVDKLLRIKDKMLADSSVKDDLEIAQRNADNFFETAILDRSKLKFEFTCLLTENENGFETCVILKRTTNYLKEFNNKIRQLINDSLLYPIRSALTDFSKLATWTSISIGDSIGTSLPSYGLIPQEYVTKTCQYIVTFAHHLEPYLSQENQAMISFINDFENRQRTVETSEHVVQYWLKLLTGRICQQFLSSIFNFKGLSENGMKQLIIDIDYLKNVLDDLGVELSSDLATFHQLLIDSTTLSSACMSSDEADDELSLEHSQLKLNLRTALKEMRKKAR